MLQTLGCDTKVTSSVKEGLRQMPKNDGTGDSKLYLCKQMYRLLINGNSMYQLSQLGLKTNRLQWEVKKPQRESSQFIKVESVEPLPDLYDTFCFTEPKRNKGMFNGILTGQCAEVVQYTAPDTVAVCFLTSLVVKFFVDDKGCILYDKLEKALNIIVRNLNRSIDRNRYTTKEAKKGAEQQRAIGVGIQGLSDVFFKLSIPYDSPEALDLTRRLEEAIHYYTIKGSMEYSKKVGTRLFKEDSLYPIEKGEFHWEKYEVETVLDWESLRKDILKYGVSNSMFNAQMPTACVSRDSIIRTSEGNKSYTEILKENNIDFEALESKLIPTWVTLSKPFSVFNENNDLEECSKIYYNSKRETLDISMGDGSVFTCTYNHKFKVNRGGSYQWIMAEDLKEGDDVLSY